MTPVCIMAPRRTVALALSCSIIGLAAERAASAQQPPTIPGDGHARVQYLAEVTGESKPRLRFTVGCPALTTKCSGTVRIKSAKPVRTGRDRRKRVVLIARSSFPDLAPGDSVTLTKRVQPAARYRLRRRCVLRAVGYVDNPEAPEPIQTSSPMRIVRC